ncbi:MAG: DUF2119 family protein, partial [Candidatus Methanoperedens sp.]|nr:DUF2119 family protein [Candidatus Methanoperedens sp.]
KIGVPPFTELEEKVLIGSVSPLIRTSEFSRDDFCFTLEMPDPYSEKALKMPTPLISLSSATGQTMDNIHSAQVENYVVRVPI